jgi:hypothetical protein
MSLTGSRATLVTNVCALIVACPLAAEIGYIVYEYSLHPNWGLLGIDEAFWVAFVPAATMFIIRNRLFSYCFLFLYIAVTILTFPEVRVFYLGTYKPVASDIPLGLMAPFYVLSLACLVAYPVISLIRIVILGIKAEMDHPSS